MSGTGRGAGDYLLVVLKSQKNRPDGSRLVRGCWCRECPRTCPVHVLGPLLSKRQSGTKLFPHATAAGALRVLREMLDILGLPKAELYRTHDFRRGHAKDLQLSGAWLHALWVAWCMFVAYRRATLPHFGSR